VLSIDIMRGATIALMILVNDPGDWQEVYAPLRHAEWNGYTAADLVFPNFLFVAGASLVFSLQSRIERGDSKLELARGLGRRSFNLLLLKLFIAGLPTFRLRRIRIFGVLFRTALCSLAAGLILLVTLSTSVVLAIASSLLGGYYLLLRLPIAGLNRPLLDADNNIAAWLDRKVAHLFHGELHTGALYNVTHDPEGLLSSLPAVSTVLLGACAALTMRSAQLSPGRKAVTLALAGATSLVAGHACDRDLPINKNLWTSSYALAAAGWSLLALSALYWLYDVKQVSRKSRLVEAATLPVNIFGANALVAYAVSIAGHKVARYIHVEHGGHSISLRTHVYRKTFARSQSTPLRSLGFAAAYAALCFLPNLFLWRRKIFVKI
jgi:predicted acyltransferase